VGVNDGHYRYSDPGELPQTPDLRAPVKPLKFALLALDVARRIYAPRCFRVSGHHV
jgi:hypothetical protein